MSRAASTTPLRNKWRRFRRNRRGSAAVEFALVAPVFFALLFAIIETAIMFFASQVLETMTANASRLIMTGTEQNSGDVVDGRLQAKGVQPDPRAVQLLQHLCRCANCPDLQQCDASARPIDANGIFMPPNNYAPGGSSSIVIVRVFYPWQLFVTGLGYNISNMAAASDCSSPRPCSRTNPIEDTRDEDDLGDVAPRQP